MKNRYNIKWLTEKFENGDKLKFLFFWGQTNSSNNSVTNSCFSQWYESPFELNGIEYKTSEHWMMSQKALLFDNKEIHEQIVNSASPGEAKELGRKVVGFDETVWKENRIEIVRLGNIHKFNQNKELGKYLINTKERILVEASPVDTIWGIGLTKDSEKAKNIYSWRGLNLLGFALMEARDFLRSYGFFKGNFNFKPPWLIEPNIESQNMYWRMGKAKKF
jgi:ribA/ribD-fused uncharacterized protein